MALHFKTACLTVGAGFLASSVLLPQYPPWLGRPELLRARAIGWAAFLLCTAAPSSSPLALLIPQDLAYSLLFQKALPAPPGWERPY